MASRSVNRGQTPFFCSVFFLFALACALHGCGSNTPAPVEDRSGGGQSSSNLYVVQRGDTLYSIAFRYGFDFRKMAAANNIPAPYTIYPGQKLKLKEAAIPPPRKTAPAPQPAPAMEATKSTTAAKAPAKPASQSTVTEPARSVATTGWRWPAEGKVVRGYSSSVHKGIDIDGNRGDAIRAVADGTVVYAGTGIVGLGELLIIKHSEVYLSAYAHNQHLLVGEGERVRSGQKIATKGSSGTDTVKLHFEIRREGKPIDPKKLLPRR
jgi:lipoprotein NlpD